MPQKKKFGEFAHRKIRHDFLFNRRLLRELHQWRRLFLIVTNKTNAQEYTLGLVEVLGEASRAVVMCLKEGYVASALNELRLVQEASEKVLALYSTPGMAEGRTIKPATARKALKEFGFPSWPQTYQNLSEIAHLSKNFVLHKYPSINYAGRESSISRMWVEYYLVLLNFFVLRALYVLYLELKPRVGGDSVTLGLTLKQLMDVFLKDWDRVKVKVKDTDWQTNEN